VEIVGKGGESAVVGEALEDLCDVRDPERTLEAGANFLEPLAKAHVASGDARRDDSRVEGGYVHVPPPICMNIKTKEFENLQFVNA